MLLARKTITACVSLLVSCSAAFAGLKEDAEGIRVSGGEDHTLILTANNWVWGCGPNGYRVGEVTYYYGVLGTGSNDPDLDQKVLTRTHGPNDVNYLDEISDIAAGWKHSLALDVNGFVWSWGWNSEGQLGDGTDLEKHSPVQVLSGEQDPNSQTSLLRYIELISAGRSGQHSLVVDANGYGYGWGYNEYGQCGNDANDCDELTPVYVRQGEQPVDPNDANDSLKHIVDISAGSNNSIALEADLSADPNAVFEGCVYTWGCNMWGEEPLDTMITDGWGLLGNASDVNFSDTPVKVLCGEQDVNEPNQVYLKYIVAVSAGWDHLMALEKDDPYHPNLTLTGRVYTWGNNGQGWDSGGGRLGNGSATDGNSTPVLVLRAGLT
jgi:alpha-tubulin suppressor-like RCC1 family protein